MIALAGETASSLSDLASGAAATKKGDSSDDDEGKSMADRIAEAAKKNGEEYLQKVARVHSLLMPHADKVVAYRNHEVDTGGGIGGGGGGPDQEATKSAPAVSVAGGGTEIEDEKEVDKDASNVSAAAVEGDKKNNMYAAKVEMRLALERRDVVKEFLRLEKEELGMTMGDDKGADENGGNDSATKGKRKRQG
mmetsp:Transcript_10997/g.22429  ORF Transcript_10997/g.22429 Transcript_10997/m.22429 type:complete len:193 (+) Transcript_10997:455-1033(+)